MRAARLRSPLQNPSGSALIRGRVLSNQLLRTKATVFPPAQEKSWLALLKNTLHRLGSRAPLQPRTESPGFKSHNLVDHRVRPAAAHFKRSNRNCQNALRATTTLHLGSSDWKLTFPRTDLAFFGTLIRMMHLRRNANHFGDAIK